MSPTGRSATASRLRIARRRGSAIALKASEVVAARDIPKSYSDIGICQELFVDPSGREFLPFVDMLLTARSGTLPPMKTPIARSMAVLMILLLLASAPQSWATCGGGGGGGMGGMSGGMAPGMAPTEQVYHVPWRLITAQDPPVSGLIVYWVPTGQEELKKSSLLFSRSLSLYASQCVTMGVVDTGTPIGQKLAAGEKLPLAILANPDGTTIAKAENQNGYLKADQVEKLVETELKKRESAIKEQLDDAKNKAKSGDNQTAIQEYRAVLEQKCLFPNRAKDAAKGLKKLGVNDSVQLFDAPVFDPAKSAEIDRTMRAGLKAENRGNYPEALRLYSAAHDMDPADPVPLRYIGEVYRHETGQWDLARTTFDQILAIPADPLSRAVALHGLGKMTIHEGDFKKGLGLMEDSVKTYPLALAYRNLAVYWNSEGNATDTEYYVKKALALDPTDSYNLVFAAAYMAGNGQGEQALKIARENEALLPASYNLAAIYAQTGQREKALAYLKRHFFEYERYQEVRSKEMMEARVDAVFASLKTDPTFITLTSGADGKLAPAQPTGMAH
jgi:tetratricopeptide (TPR) repeat protein